MPTAASRIGGGAKDGTVNPLLYYILDDQGNSVEASLEAWGEFFGQSDKRQLARDEVGDITISTVFLGIDHGFGDGPPVLWETIIFGGKHDRYEERYSSRDDALVGHRHAVWIAGQ